MTHELYSVDVFSRAGFELEESRTLAGQITQYTLCTGQDYADASVMGKHAGAAPPKCGPGWIVSKGAAPFILGLHVDLGIAPHALLYRRERLTRGVVLDSTLSGPGGQSGNASKDFHSSSHLPVHANCFTPTVNSGPATFVGLTYAWQGARDPGRLSVMMSRSAEGALSGESWREVVDAVRVCAPTGFDSQLAVIPVKPTGHCPAAYAAGIMLR